VIQRPDDLSGQNSQHFAHRWTREWLEAQFTPISLLSRRNDLCDLVTSARRFIA
jgi:hypothetical protein